MGLEFDFQQKTVYIVGDISLNRLSFVNNPLGLSKVVANGLVKLVGINISGKSNANSLSDNRISQILSIFSDVIKNSKSSLRFVNLR